MAGSYLIVSKKILPEYLEQVIAARELLESREAKTVTEAVMRAGISRNTYYKYKDYVFRMNESGPGNKASISMSLRDEPGSLGRVLSRLSSANASIITISQSVPVAGKAAVLFTLSTEGMIGTIDELIDELKKIPQVSSVYLNSVE